MSEVPPGPRARTRLRLQRLLAVAAAASIAEACDANGRRRPAEHPQPPMPYETNPYQASDPVGPREPNIRELVTANARWLPGSFGDRIELRLRAVDGAAVMRVDHADGVKVVETALTDSSELGLTLEPAATPNGQTVFVHVEVKIEPAGFHRIAVVQLTLVASKADPIPCVIGD
jgi:hypothetical protein